MPITPKQAILNASQDPALAQRNSNVIILNTNTTITSPTTGSGSPITTNATTNSTAPVTVTPTVTNVPTTTIYETILTPPGSYGNSNVGAYLGNYTGYLANATHATVADSANSVTWSNIAGKPDLTLDASVANLSALSNTVANITWANLSGKPDLSSYATTSAVSTLSNTVANITWANLSGKPDLTSYATTSAVSTLSNTVANITWANLSGAPTIPTSLTSLNITDGTNNQVLKTDGNGHFSFDTVNSSSSNMAGNVGTFGSIVTLDNIRAKYDASLGNPYPQLSAVSDAMTVNISGEQYTDGVNGGVYNYGNKALPSDGSWVYINTGADPFTYMNVIALDQQNQKMYRIIFMLSTDQSTQGITIERLV